MTVKELREILEEYDADQEILVDVWHEERSINRIYLTTNKKDDLCVLIEPE